MITKRYPEPVGIISVVKDGNKLVDIVTQPIPPRPGTKEIDPVFAASPVGDVTEADVANWNNAIAYAIALG